MNLIGKGAEAEVVSCRFLGEAALCKRRTRKAYRVHELDARIRLERTRREARVLHAAKHNGVRCPLVRHVDETKCELFISRLEGVLLREALSATALCEAGRQLALLHATGITHGDSTCSNFMVETQGTLTSRVWLIDFGLADYSSDAEEQATDLLLMKKSVSPKQFQSFLKGYCSATSEAKPVLGRLEKIESRGRYVVRAITG
ncbi:Kae1-associated kinase Bud32 [Candidatus Micrarchaeota archaeon CG1_02_51_15]|nr:MAG: Kae1-associated kinase Bud32 [Candidatus Micrarchaeota archaeon CG1_02_51_15]